MKQRPRIYYTETQRALMRGSLAEGRVSFRRSPCCLIEITPPYKRFWRGAAKFVRRNGVAPDWR